MCEGMGKTESMAENSHKIYGKGRITRLSREKATQNADIVAPPPTSCQWCKHCKDSFGVLRFLIAY